MYCKIVCFLKRLKISTQTNCVYYHVVYWAGCRHCAHHVLEMCTKFSKNIRLFFKAASREITLVVFQLDAQNSYLFTYNTFIKILYMFRALPFSSSGGLFCYCIYAASGIVTLCRWLSCARVKKEQLFRNRCTVQSPADSVDTTVCICIQLRCRPPENQQCNVRKI
jgi:hypothetical protein